MRTYEYSWRNIELALYNFVKAANSGVNTTLRDVNGGFGVFGLLCNFQ